MASQLIFALEASSVEGLALQEAEHDFDLVQPTGCSRGEVRLDSSLERSVRTRQVPYMIAEIRVVGVRWNLDLVL